MREAQKRTRAAAGVCREEQSLADAVRVSGAALKIQTRYWLAGTELQSKAYRLPPSSLVTGPTHLEYSRKKQSLE